MTGQEAQCANTRPHEAHTWRMSHARYRSCPGAEERDDEREALRSDIADEISGVQVGVGYESTTIGITAALEAADLLIAADYRKHPEPEITEEMVEAAWAVIERDGLTVLERAHVRAALAAALRVPIEEGEQS